MSNRKQFGKIQELVYELKVKTVMTRKVIAVEHDTMMSELRVILRDNRISGAPVLEGGNLAGMISVEDFINWLAGGQANCTVAEKMTLKVKTVYDDEPLVHAISKFEGYGFGRFPVINRKTGRITGMITKGDVIEGLLRELEIDYHEEEIHQYRASHFLEDLIADKTTLIFEYLVDSKNFEQGGKVASEIKKTLGRLGIHPGIVRRAAIATYEAEMNVIIYAEGGAVTVTLNPERIFIEVKDRGPGIPDVEKALEPGYSTAPVWVRELGFGAGMGLTNIKNCAEKFEIDSIPGKGTSLKIDILISEPVEKKCG